MIIQWIASALVVRYNPRQPFKEPIVTDSSLRNGRFLNYNVLRKMILQLVTFLSFAIQVLAQDATTQAAEETTTAKNNTGQIVETYKLCGITNCKLKAFLNCKCNHCLLMLSYKNFILGGLVGGLVGGLLPAVLIATIFIARATCCRNKTCCGKPCNNKECPTQKKADVNPKTEV